MKKRIRDYGIKIGEMDTGRLNKITDVRGIKVGHSTIDTRDNKTGVTVLLPSEDNIFKEKLVAGSHIINGYGKTSGLVQIEELGTLESLIAMTNTLNLGKVHEGLVDYTINRCKEEGLELTSFNPLVCECNDSFLNNIQDRVVEKEHLYEAIKNAKEDFEEGDVGAGKGMSCHELKGGIGSASRVFKLAGEEYNLGVMVLSNHGLLKDLNLNGKNIGRDLDRKINPDYYKVEGSIIILIATDLPLTSRQLKRLCKRSVIGLGRLGSNVNNGSGDIAIAFSTANKIGLDDDFISCKFLNDEKINDCFRAVAEATEEAILNSLITSERVVGYKGNTRESLKDHIGDFI